jgi:hypothetical protein
VSNGNVVRRAQIVLNPGLAILAVVLLGCPVFAQTAMPQSTTPLTGNVPDESVVPQWRSTLSKVLEARKSDFVQYHAKVSTAKASLTDQELINGPSQQPPRKNPDAVVPQLEGAGGCKMVWIPSVMDTYTCYFEPTGPNAVDMQKDFVKLVRLVEKATGVTATMYISPKIGPSSESRSVACGFVTVGAYWQLLPKPTPDLWAPTDSFLSVSASWTKSDLWANGQTAQAAATSEIDTVLKSGSYTPLPPVQRIGSSGSGPASIKVKNDTGYTLTLVYGGQLGTTVDIPAHQSSTVSLPAGSYRVMGRVSAPNVLPFIGDETVGPGDIFETSFYIANR